MNRRMTAGQAAACVFLALLAPMTRVLPGSAARMGGGLCWLGAIPAFIVIVGFDYFLLSFLRRDSGSLGDMFLRCLGPIFGRAALAVYAAAFLLEAGFIVRVGADRIIVTLYPESGPMVFYTVMLLLCLMAAMGRLRTLGQTAVLLRPVMLLILLSALVFSTKELDLSLLWPTDGSPADILAAALPIINIGTFAGTFGFLAAYVCPEGKRLRCYLPWLAVFAALCLLLCAAVVGSFGAKLTGQLRYPFFVFVRDLSFFNLGSRIEAFIVALWVFSDFVLCVLLFRAAHEAIRPIFTLPEVEASHGLTLKSGRWLLPIEALCAWLAAYFIAPNELVLQFWSDKIIPPLFAVLMLLGLPSVYIIGRLRRKI